MKVPERVVEWEERGRAPAEQFVGWPSRRAAKDGVLEKSKGERSYGVQHE